MASSSSRGYGGRGQGRGGRGKGRQGHWESGKWVEDDPATVLSKKMSDILRHSAHKFGLAMRSDGFVDVEEMLAIDNGKFFEGFTQSDVLSAVSNNAKQRFLLSEDERARLIVRANQGHTIKTVDDDSLLEEVKDMADLKARSEVPVHGTYWKRWDESKQQYVPCWEVISREGLKPMGRNHIHFASKEPSESEAVISGMRTTCEIVIYLDVDKAFKAGMRLYRSSNGVLLTRGLQGVVAPEFFEKVIQLRPHKVLWPEPKKQAPLGERQVPGLDPSSQAAASHSKRWQGGKSKGQPKPDEPKPKAEAKSKAAAPKPKVAAKSVPDSWEEDESPETESNQQETSRDNGRTSVPAGLKATEKNAELQKELKKLQKKLRQIESIEAKGTKAEDLMDQELKEKLSGKADLERKISELEAAMAA